MKDTDLANYTQLHDQAWWPLLGASLCMLCGQASVAFYTFGVFVPGIIANTHWSGNAVAAAISPGVLIAAFVAPFVGTVCDRFGVRMVALVGGPAFGFGLVLLGMVPRSPEAFSAAMALMYFLSFAGAPIIYAQMLTGWFDKRRGLALGVMFGCGALGIAVWPRYAAFLIAHWGWRQAYVVLGGTAGTVIFLTALLLLKNAPKIGPAAVEPARTQGLRMGEALRTGRFWKIAALFLVLTAVLGGMAVNFPVLLRLQGANAGTAASIMSVIGICMLLGELSLAVLLDRWFSPHVTIATTAVATLAFCLLIFASSKIAFTAAAGFLGFGLGSEYAVSAYIVSRAFGFRSFGAIYGMITLATSIGAAIGPAVIGISLQVTPGTLPLYAGASACLMMAILILLTFRKADLPFGGNPLP